MPKFPKPFFRSARNGWFIQFGKEQIKLAADEAEALMDGASRLSLRRASLVNLG